MAERRRRRAVEIYFILYLAALVFLLPTGKEDLNKFVEGKNILISRQPFSLIPEKSTLTCKMYMDSTGPRVLALDSVNTIYYSGDIEDINFDVIVEDQSIRQRIQLGHDQQKYNTKYFRIEEHKDQHSVSFFWNPPMFERQSKNYLVRVIATAKLKNNSSSELGSMFSERVFPQESQFSLNMIYVNEASNIPFSQFNLLSNLNKQDTNKFRDFPMEILSTPGPFRFDPLNLEKSGVAGMIWNNSIMASGINLKTELLAYAKCEVIRIPEDNGGSASITQRGDNSLELTGRVPNSGYMRVMVKIIRKIDNEEKIAQFIVKPKPIENPEFATTMYPEQKYPIDPKLPIPDPDQEIRAYIKDKTQNIRAMSRQGESFTFTPELTDTNREFYLERYINNNLLEQPFKIKVLPYPMPDVQNGYFEKKGVFRLVTYSYGWYNKERNIVTVEARYNAVVRETFGQNKDKNSFLIIQYFTITPKDPNQPFNFVFVLQDKMGRVTKAYPYREE